MPPLTSDAPGWMLDRRGRAEAAVKELGRPDPAEEVWRYSPVGDRDLGAVPDATELVVGDKSLEALLEEADLVIDVPLGVPVLPDESPAGVSMQLGSSLSAPPALLGQLASDDEPLVALNSSRLRELLVIEVAAGALVAGPIVLLHRNGDGASYPRSILRVGRGAAVTVVELFVGGSESTLCAPVTEIEVADGGNLRYGALQLLDRSAWHLATVAAEVGQDASISEVTAGLGAAYDRLRTDVLLSGRGASSVLRSTYLGDGEQVHDLRTKQDHAAPRTTSDLLCKGAVRDSARSIYSGLIKIRHGATRSDAMQSNHNLVLSEQAHADSVPNLDISENDVRCSHASTVGPIDEDQRFYLEARGIEPAEAERLLVRGFFRDLLDRSPIAELAHELGRLIEARLEREAD